MEQAGLLLFYGVVFALRKTLHSCYSPRFVGRFHNTSLLPEERGPTEQPHLRGGPLTIALLRPRIPQNTGAIARLCAATKSSLELVEPWFHITDAKLKRAGLDYWHHLDVSTYDSIGAWLKRAKAQHTHWWIEVGSPKIYTEATFATGDVLVFGDEQEGIPQEFLEQNPSRHLSLPTQNVRSMNLAMVAGIVSFEALRQLQFPHSSASI